jgi:hypothetical protein
VTRFLILALQAGEPYRVSLALAQLAALPSLARRSDREQVLRAFRPAEEFARKANHPHGVAYVEGVKAWNLLSQGYWRAALDCTQQAENIFRRQCTGVHAELSCVHLNTVACLFFLGELKEMAHRMPHIASDAWHRDDVMSHFTSRTFFGNTVWLAADDVGEARRQARRCATAPADRSFYQHHLFELIGLTRIDLYADEGRVAWDRLARMWRSYSRSYHSRIPLYRLGMYHLRARAALASLGADRDRRQLIRSAKGDAKRIEHEDRAWSNPLARLVRVGIASAEGNQEQAVSQLQAAIEELDAAEMALFAAAGRRRLGQLLGGDEGATLLAAGTDFMTNQGVRAPDHMTRMLVPCAI